ncbi:AbrB family looped-hinge helix DNA binding protein [Rhizobium sp. PP-F2F-G20b]|uniref:AbrB/MazE/SpoVT family DNA-binding domain-containing protein n=1 Tax=Rhizobium sp. PP-F2F-G48 TaxID=2135651 RepID=UPI000D864A68|nr:AbrB/MazE/SpoVT family DNA-binding domain-containing protein [Rhizobium sp. PP-F2F-G48]PYE41923.1 AbrB family looped-hinge helix DNA binding protein [Rhizobium sp. PP-F2F-G20b]TCM53600.1 AbrB family looped-hinge helix DNA binding protein [Rhizobium sp. PP-F2F-G48]
MTKILTMTAKGQITIPKETREALGLRAGDQLVWSVLGNEVVITPKNIDFRELAGLLGDPPAGKASLQELDEAVMEAAGQHVSGLGNMRDDAA